MSIGLQSPLHGHGVATAAAAALLAAAESVRELSLRHPPDRVSACLSLHAEQMASSPLARDQLLCRALEAAGLDIAAGCEPLAQWPLFFSRRTTPTEAARAGVREWVFAQAGDGLGEGWDVARAVEARLVQERGDAFEAARDQDERLGFEAWLQMALWDDPRIAATAEIRRLMRAGGVRLSERLRGERPMSGAEHALRLLSRLLGPKTASRDRGEASS
ncbi:MAG: hypothetical protein J7521_08410 [Caulobacter sp.]|nr:hypothetical protein [Caulobacter sp.]